MTISPKDNDLHLSPLSGRPLSPTSFSLETQPLEIDPEDQLFKTHCWLISLLSVMIFMIIIIISVIIFIPNITKTTIIILYNFEWIKKNKNKKNKDVSKMLLLLLS